MKKSMLMITALAALSATQAQGDLFVEFSGESGGDVIMPTNTHDSIDAGGGLKLAIGMQTPPGHQPGAGSIRLAVGYLFDRIDAQNGDAEFNTLTFDAMYLVNSGPHRFGVGATLHMAPQYSDDLDNLPPLDIEFDDALGFVMQYGYHFVPGLELGVKLTRIDYESPVVNYDASSFGVFLSNGF